MICSIDKVIPTSVPINCVHCRNKSTFINYLVLSGGGGGFKAYFVLQFLHYNCLSEFKKFYPLWQFSQMDEILLEKQLKWWMVLMMNRSSVTFICNRLYIYLHSYDIRLTSKYYIWTKQFAFVYCIINSCSFQNKQEEKSHSCLRSILLYLFSLNMFAFMVTIQFFLIAAKDVVANIVLPPTPLSHSWLRPCHLSILPLCK